MEHTGVLAGSERARERAGVGAAHQVLRRGNVTARAKDGLRAARLAKGLTLEAAAKAAGVPMHTAVRAESSTAPAYDDARAALLRAIEAAPSLAGSTVGAAIYAARVQTGLAQGPFGELMGVRTETVCRWERGDHAPPPPRARQRLFAEVGLDLRAFYPGDVLDESERGDVGRFKGLVFDATLTPAAGEVDA